MGSHHISCDICRLASPSKPFFVHCASADTPCLPAHLISVDETNNLMYDHQDWLMKTNQGGLGQQDKQLQGRKGQQDTKLQLFLALHLLIMQYGEFAEDGSLVNADEPILIKAGCYKKRKKECAARAAGRRKGRKTMTRSRTQINQKVQKGQEAKEEVQEGQDVDHATTKIK